MNKSKNVKIYMIVTGIICAIILVTFMILNHYIFHFDLLLSIGLCFVSILLWILLNYLGINIILKDYKG